MNELSQIKLPLYLGEALPFMLGVARQAAVSRSHRRSGQKFWYRGEYCSPMEFLITTDCTL
jgi:hypothetical protein